MTDPEIYRTLLGVYNREISVDHAYGLLRQERDERLRISKYDALKAGGFIILGFGLVYALIYFLSPSPCH